MRVKDLKKYTTSGTLRINNPVADKGKNKSCTFAIRITPGLKKRIKRAKKRAIILKVREMLEIMV